MNYTFSPLFFSYKSILVGFDVNKPSKILINALNTEKYMNLIFKTPRHQEPKILLSSMYEKTCLQGSQSCLNVQALWYPSIIFIIDLSKSFNKEWSKVQFIISKFLLMNLQVFISNHI